MLQNASCRSNHNTCRYYSTSFPYFQQVLLKLLIQVFTEKKWPSTFLGRQYTYIFVVSFCSLRSLFLLVRLLDGMYRRCIDRVAKLFWKMSGSRCCSMNTRIPSNVRSNARRVPTGMYKLLSNMQFISLYLTFRIGHASLFRLSHWWPSQLPCSLERWLAKEACVKESPWGQEDHPSIWSNLWST